MNQVPADWIAFFLFLILGIAVIIAEVVWLMRRGWTTSGKAVAYVLLTDLLGLGVGSFTLFAALGIMMMMAFGASGSGSTAPESAYWAVLIFGVVFPPLFLFALKRLFLLVFGINTGRTAWLYSLATTALIILVVFVPPTVLFWAFMRFA